MVESVQINSHSSHKSSSREGGGAKHQGTSAALVKVDIVDVS